MFAGGIDGIAGAEIDVGLTLPGALGGTEAGAGVEIIEVVATLGTLNGAEIEVGAGIDDVLYEGGAAGGVNNGGGYIAGVPICASSGPDGEELGADADFGGSPSFRRFTNAMYATAAAAACSKEV